MKVSTEDEQSRMLEPIVEELRVTFGINQNQQIKALGAEKMSPKRYYTIKMTI